MQKLSLVIITATLLGVAGASYAFGPGPGCHGMSPHAEMKDFMFANLLELSDEQQASIDALRKNHRAQMQAQFAGSRPEHLFDLRPDQSDYRDQVRVIAQQKAQRVEQMIIARAQLQGEIYALLTPQQQDKLEQMRAEIRQKKRRGVAQWWEYHSEI